MRCMRLWCNSSSALQNHRQHGNNNARCDYSHEDPSYPSRLARPALLRWLNRQIWNCKRVELSTVFCRQIRRVGRWAGIDQFDDVGALRRQCGRRLKEWWILDGIAEWKRSGIGARVRVNDVGRVEVVYKDGEHASLLRRHRVDHNTRACE